MSNMKQIRKALISSLLAFVLCFSMLIGTTFAWFTDSVTSSGNIIQTGNLDVEMSWADGKMDPTASTTVWTDASTGPIFNYDKWEPGYTEVRHIKIENKGSLALQYKVSIVPEGELAVTENEHTLADVIDVYYLDPAEQIADRTALAAKTPMSTLTAAMTGMGETAKGVLVPDAEAGDGFRSFETITIALKMKEEAGNEYQDMSMFVSNGDNKGFAIQLLATQYTYESDSFGDGYDTLATYPEANVNPDEPTTVDIGTKDALIAALKSGSKLAGTGDVVINLNQDFDLSGTEWVGLDLFVYYDNPSNFTINGNNHTIKNITAVANAEGHAGLFAKSFSGSNGLTINDLTIADSTFDGGDSTYSKPYSAAGAFIGCADRAYLELNNCSAINVEMKNAKYSGGLVGYASGDTTLNNCSVKGNANGNTKITAHSAGGAIGFAVATKLEINKLVVKNTELQGKKRQGGMIGGNQGELTIKNYTEGDIDATRISTDSTPSESNGKLIGLADHAYTLNNENKSVGNQDGHDEN